MAKTLFDVFSVICTIIVGVCYVWGLYGLGKKLGITDRFWRVMSRVDDFNDLAATIIGIPIFFVILPAILTLIFVIGANQGLKNLLDFVK